MKYILLLILVIILSVHLYKKYTKKIEHIGSNHTPLYRYTYPGLHPSKSHINNNDPTLNFNCDSTNTNPINQNNNRSVPLAQNRLL